MTPLQKNQRRRQDSKRSRTFLRSLRFESLEDRLVLATIDLGQANVTIYGVEADDESGIAVSGAGDVNGDGFDDIVIGARYGDAASNAKNAAGESYLVFGKANWSATPTIDLANLGAAGVTLYGANIFDYSGRAVSSAGDVNGDGFDDLLIGAVEADAASNAKNAAGESYLLFGKANWSSTPSIDFASLGTAGVTLFGADAVDYSGRAVSGAGDVNGDGFDDLLIGAHYGDGPSNARIGSGESALVFGKADWSATPTIDLGNLGPAGVTIFGANDYDGSGIAVSNAGDVNGDGFDDLIIGARYGDAASNAKDAAGDSYIVFGKANWSATLTLDLANLGTAGVTIFGVDVDDYSGISVSGAGDVNGDGFDDVLIGAVGGDYSDNGTENVGESYLLFGKANWSTTPTIDLANLLSSAGVTFYGVDIRDNSGLEVSSAGDINGDGFDDLLIGARYADAIDNLKPSAGDSYVVFGKPNWSRSFFLTNLNSAGITISGADALDYSGFSLSSAGDVDGDGFDDLVIGAAGGGAANNIKLGAGESYLIFGGDQFTSSVTELGTAASETLTGTNSADIMIGHRGNDVVVGLGGADVLRGGQGNDVLAVSDLTFKRIAGGNGTDTLRLDGSGIVLDLTTRLDNRIQGIEQINLTGSGSNTLTLNVLEVLNISDESNLLVVLRDANDIVNRGAGWTRQADEILGGSTFEVYTQGAATLKIQTSIADLAIIKTPSVTAVLAGGSFFYTVHVTNSGPATATGVTVTDSLPAGLLFDSVNSSSTCSADGQVVTCNIGSLAAGADSSPKISVRVASSVPHDTVLSNTAILSANESDPTPGDHSDTATVTVNREADLLVTKTASADPAIAGNILNYVVKIENRGPSDASGVVVTDTLPAGLTFRSIFSSSTCSAVGQVVTCNVGTVAAGTSSSPQIAVIVASSLPIGAEIINTANVVDNETDPTPDDHSATVTVTVDRQANLQVTKTASANPVLAGGSFRYTIQVVNAGPSDATGVTVLDALPTGLSFDAANSSSSCSAIGQDVTCTIGDLTASAPIVQTISVLVASSLTRGTVLSNTATVSGNETDLNSGDQSSTATVTVNVSPDPFPWQNVRDPLDVNDDQSVSPIDVLQIINELNSRRFSSNNGQLPVPPPPGPHPFFDVSGDNFVVPNDALTIINFLNTRAGGEGESTLLGAQSVIAGNSPINLLTDSAVARPTQSINRDAATGGPLLSQSPTLPQSGRDIPGRAPGFRNSERWFATFPVAGSRTRHILELEDATDDIASDVDAAWRTGRLTDLLWPDEIV